MSEKERNRLYVDVICDKCGKARPLPKRNFPRHGFQWIYPPLCRRCSYDSRSLGPPVKLTCVGYHPYGARAASFATNCPGETQKKRKRLKYYKHTQDDGQHAFTDAASGKYRCKRCAGALFLLYKLEKDVKQFLARAKPNETVPKIESLKQLLECRRDCSKLTYTDDSGAVVVFDQYSFAHNDNKRKWGPRANSITQQTGLLVRRSKQANVVKGLCQFCGKIVLSAHEGRATKVHAKCYQNYSGGKFRKGIPPEPPKRWRPIGLENLRKNYSWAIRHNLGGESLGEIAKEFGVARTTVVDGIKSILARLPEPELVNKQFRDRISRLRSPEKT